VIRHGEPPSRVRSSYVDIVDLFVAPDHRNEGYGSEAVEAVKRRAAEDGADYVTVSCEWHNDGARRFYEDSGFVEKQVTYACRLD
jgi:ribosomal protein S18 acetylase RimI-like enzyme